MKPLRNRKHEKFAQEIVAGTTPVQAYVIAGYEPHRANHNRLMRNPLIASRIEHLKQEREIAARAARIPVDQMLDSLDQRGIVRLDDFFDRNAAGILSVRDRQEVPVEIAIALLGFLRESFGIKSPLP